MQIVRNDVVYKMSILHAGGHIRRPEDIRPGHLLRQHVHDIYHVVLYLDGHSTFFYNDRSEPCGPGTLVLCSPGEPHEFYYCARDYTSYIEFAFSLENDEGQPNLTVPFHELLGYYAGEKLTQVGPPIQINERQIELLRGLLETITQRLFVGNDLPRFELARLVYGVVEFLIDEVHTVSRPSVAPEMVALLKAKEEIEHRFNQEISLKQMADVAGLSLGYFGRAFRAKFKTTPMAYQRELRIRAAKNLLSSTSFMCKEIARRVGFDDIYQFSKTFRKIVGVSPTEFRNSRRRPRRRPNSRRLLTS